MIANPIIATLVTLGLALVWLRLNDFAAHRGWVSSDLSRKIIHAGTGPVFVLCWLLYSGGPFDRWLAALVPGLITAQFVLVGSGILKDEAAVKAMSRSGDRREILRGPLYYGIVFVILTLVFWKSSPTGIVALMLMCGGDGLADILGRRIKSPGLPWSQRKSVAGTLGMFVGGWVFAAAILAVFVAAGIFAAPFSAYLLPVTIIALVGTAVESLPFRDIDNLTVSLAAVVLGMLFW